MGAGHAAPSMGFALRVSDLPRGSLHREILADNVQDALAEPSSANWAAQVVGLRPPKGRSCAHIIVGLRASVLCQSHTFSCP